MSENKQTFERLKCGHLSEMENNPFERITCIHLHNKEISQFLFKSEMVV